MQDDCWFKMFYAEAWWRRTDEHNWVKFFSKDSCYQVYLDCEFACYTSSLHHVKTLPSKSFSRVMEIRKSTKWMHALEIYETSDLWVLNPKSTKIWTLANIWLDCVPKNSIKNTSEQDVNGYKNTSEGEHEVCGLHRGFCFNLYEKWLNM